MNDLIELGLFTKHGKVLVSSRIIANNFSKDHANILKTIEGETRKGKHIKGLYDGILQSSGNPRGYFITSQYKDNKGEMRKEYLLTRDGFALLVMGFTGQKALEWKLKYINAFNKMEAFIKEKLSTEWLKTRKNGKMIRRNEGDSLSKLLIYAINSGSKTYEKTPNRLYTQYTNLVNKAVGIKTGQREQATRKVLDTIAFLEDMIQHTILEEIEKGTEYHQIYRICKDRVNQIMQYAYLPKQRLIA